MPSVARSRRAKAFSVSRHIQFSGPNGEFDHTGGGLTRSGQKVSEEGALRIAGAYIANTFIADEVSSLPLKLVARDDVSRRPVQPVELKPLWERPNPDQTVMSWLATCSLSLTLHGVSYNAIGWLNNGALGRLWPIDAGNVVLERTEDQGLRLKSHGQGDLVNRADARPEFMMIPLYTLAGRLEPISPVKMAAEMLGLSQAYDATVARLMGRGLNPSMVLTATEAVPPSASRELSQQLAKMHGGAENAGGIPVVGGPGLKLERVSFSLADAEFLAQRQDVFALTMALWRVPPTVAGMTEKTTSWGTGVAEFSRGVERFTVRPVATRMQSGIESVTRWVDPGLQVRLKFDAMLAAAPKERSEVQRLNLANGLTSVERVLAQNDEPPFGDEETVFSPLSQAAEEDRRLARLKNQADAYAGLIRAGVKPEAAARAVGFDPVLLEHTGFRPVTVIAPPIEESVSAPVAGE